jgi:hypothetical protein
MTSLIVLFVSICEYSLEYEFNQYMSYCRIIWIRLLYEFIYILSNINANVLYENSYKT